MRSIVIYTLFTSLPSYLFILFDVAFFNPVKTNLDRPAKKLSLSFNLISYFDN